MHQAQVTAWGQPPKYTSVPDLPAPAEDERRLKVLACGAHQVVRGRAAGKHYTSGSLPHVPGMDGVGQADDGKVYYFQSFDIGSFSEYVNMPKVRTIPVPEGMDAVQLAGYANPAMSSWLAVKTRTTNLPKDFTVLIMGVTSASGRVAITLMRALGAKKVVGVARTKGRMEGLGLDETVVLDKDVKKTDFSAVGDVDVILDYIYGEATIALFQALRSHYPIQYVQIGGLSGQMEMELPAAVLRSKNLTIRGSGPGAWSMQDAARVLPEMVQAMTGWPKQPVKVAKLEEVEREWEDKSGERLVFVP